jgi:hypothetical protein
MQGGTPGEIDPGFVGRGRELEQLSRGLDDALAGRGRLFLLVGEPGIGKTSLCDTAAAAAAARGLPVLWGRAWEAGGAPAYWPWLDVLGGLARRLDDTTLAATLDLDGAPLLGDLVPEIRQRLPPTPAFSPPPPDEARFRLWRTVASLVRRAATPEGLVLVFDDLHSTDPRCCSSTRSPASSARFASSCSPLAVTSRRAWTPRPAS